MAFFSKRLDHAHHSYSSAMDRKLLVVNEVMSQFCYFLEGREFYMLMDRKPLTHAMDQTGDNFNSRGESASVYLRVHYRHQAHSEGGQNCG